MAWTLHYDDDTTFSHLEGSPNDSPPWGVVFVTQPNINSRDLIWGLDYLIFRSDLGYWTGHNFMGLLDQLTHFAPFIECVRPGREMDYDILKGMIKRETVKMRGK